MGSDSFRREWGTGNGERGTGGEDDAPDAEKLGKLAIAEPLNSR
ncbi:MAG: hypothetical protein SWY16_16540 [Cyanobacteriota bacterium]|nr:hypothetical protein [Cyanobacteriota bacterium]